LQETAQEDNEMDEVADADTLQVVGPFGPYGEDSWDSQRVVGGTGLDGAVLVHEAAEQYREMGQAEAVMGMWEAEDRHSRYFQMKGAAYMRDSECK
jgi:hypothetical protein